MPTSDKPVLKPYTVKVYMTVMAADMTEESLREFVKSVLQDYQGTHYTSRVKEIKVKQEQF